MPLSHEGRALPPRAVDPANQGSRLMTRGPYEAQDDFDRVLLHCSGKLQGILSLGVESEIHSSLQELASEGSGQHADVIKGLLYRILTDYQGASKLLSYMSSVTRDGYVVCLASLQRLAMEKWSKLLEGPRIQIVWIMGQLVPLAVQDLDTLCFCLLRQVAGGDLSPGNLWLATQLLEILLINRSWLYGSPTLLTTALYTYLRLLPDHASSKTPAVIELCQSEAAFCTSVLRERFQDCLVIGRDLVRLLQDVAALPEFEPIWRDLLGNPSAFQVPTFTDLAQLYVVRTPVRYLATRVTPDMETQLRFMLTHVRMGNQRRYQTWFSQRFLAAPESETLVADLIRFICGVVHPSNQILQSDVVPRWAVVGWLLKCCKSAHVEANAKLALFYDWLFFMPKTDNIMNIEPAILLMVHSIPKYADMTNSLLEFLFLLMDHYDPPHKDLLHKGVTSSVSILVKKGVVRSLEPLAANPLVGQVLRDKLQALFSNYCKLPDFPLPPPPFQPEALLRTQPALPAGHPAPQPLEIPSRPETESDTSTQRSARWGSSEAEALLWGSGDGGQGAGQVAPRGQGKGTPPVSPSGSDGEGGGNEFAAGVKRKRQTVLADEVAAELRASLTYLASAMAGPMEEAVAALDQLLQLYTAAWDSLLEAGKAEKHPRSSGGGMPNGCSVHALENSPFAAAAMAEQLADLMGKAGYQLFAPLKGMPSSEPESDETGSLTSTILRVFVSSKHPQLRRMLLTWQAQGREVGARLLCYVSRLVEELEHEDRSHFSFQGLAQGSGSDSMDHGGEVEGAPGPTDGAGGTTDRGAAEVSQSQGILGAELHERLASGSSVGPSQEGWQDAGGRGGSWGGGRGERALRPEAEMQSPGQAAVRKAFRAYEEFLQDVGNATPFPGRGPAGAGCSGLGDTRLGGDLPGRVKAEGGGGAAAAGREGPDGVLLASLRTCLLWNSYRFLRVLPSVLQYLPHLATGNVEVLRLLLATADPVEVAALEASLALGEFSVIGLRPEGAETVVRGSLQWESVEQQWFWQLMVAEAHGCGWSQEAMLAVVATVAESAKAGPCAEALSGLLALLRSGPPTPQLLGAVLRLPPSGSKVAAAILGAWTGSHPSLLGALLEQSSKGGVKAEAQGSGEIGGRAYGFHESNGMAAIFFRFLARRGLIQGREQSARAQPDRDLFSAAAQCLARQDSEGSRDSLNSRVLKTGVDSGRAAEHRDVNRHSESRERFLRLQVNSGVS